MQTFAKKRSESEVEQDRAQRVGKASRAAGIYEAESPIQGLYIFLDEPESSTGARVFSLLIVTAIMASSVSFVAETHSYVRTRALPRALFSLRVHAREATHTCRCRLSVQGRSELPPGLLRRDGDASAPRSVRGGFRLRVHILVLHFSCGGHVQCHRPARQPHRLRRDPRLRAQLGGDLRRAGVQRVRRWLRFGGSFGW